MQKASLAISLGLLLTYASNVHATPPFTGNTIEFDSTPNNLGATPTKLRAVAVGDLDGDGDLDVVTGSVGSGEDFEVIAWQNDGTPFTGAWAQQDVGASTSIVRSVAVGDLDGDGDLDIVSGSGSGEDFEVIAWQNDGTPFNGTWSQQDVGASTANVESVAVGDVSGSFAGEDFEVIAWRNDGTPFNGTWTPQDVGASIADVQSVSVGDLDGDGDLDIVSGSSVGEDFEVIAWRNALYWGLDAAERGCQQ